MRNNVELSGSHCWIETFKKSYLRVQPQWKCSESWTLFQSSLIQVKLQTYVSVAVQCVSAWNIFPSKSSVENYVHHEDCFKQMLMIFVFLWHREHIWTYIIYHIDIPKLFARSPMTSSYFSSGCHRYSMGWSTGELGELRSHRKAASDWGLFRCFGDAAVNFHHVKNKQVFFRIYPLVI